MIYGLYLEWLLDLTRMTDFYSKLKMGKLKIKNLFSIEIFNYNLYNLIRNGREKMNC